MILGQRLQVVQQRQYLQQALLVLVVVARPLAHREDPLPHVVRRNLVQQRQITARRRNPTGPGVIQVVVTVGRGHPRVGPLRVMMMVVVMVHDQIVRIVVMVVLVRPYVLGVAVVAFGGTATARAAAAADRCWTRVAAE